MSDHDLLLAKSLLNLRDLIRTLRAPEGCPWDRKQTPATLKKHLLEETYEVIDAIDHGSSRELCHELGDLLMQIYFLADIFEESGTFSLLEVSESIQNKLIRRHPHVFEPGPNLSEEEIHQQWEQIKERERLHNLLPVQPQLPPLPSLLCAQKWLSKAEHVSTLTREERTTLHHQLDNMTNQSTAQEIVGKLLCDCIQGAEKHHLDAETCLRQFLLQQRNKSTEND